MRHFYLKRTRPPAPSLARHEATPHREYAPATPSSEKMPPVVQAKLRVGAPDDKYEREADRVADTVMRMPKPAVQRRCACGAAAGPDGECEACKRKRLALQRKATPSATGAHPSADIPGVLNSQGSPLNPTTRSYFEPRFAHDFGNVRVHHDTRAAASADAVHARAYTVGHDLVFSSGQYQPDTDSGKRLLAHELTHVVQQSNGAPRSIQRDGAGGGSTEFEDRVTQWQRPTKGIGPVQGKVERTETEPAHGSEPAHRVHRGHMNVRFDPADCSITIPFGYKFVQAQKASSKSWCNDPPPTTKVPLLKPAAFKKLKDNVIANANRGLNGWYDVRLSGKSCPKGCSGKPLPIKVVAREDDTNPDKTIEVVNRGGRANSGTICARSWSSTTAVHEAGHQILGVGDEYPETDKRLLKKYPHHFTEARVRRDYSAMGPEEHSRLAMFQERHFNAVKVFIEKVFPGCKATLVEHPRSRPLDFRLRLSGGYASLGGLSGSFLGAGLRLGIPLDRMRQWEFVIGPQLRYLDTSENSQYRTAFLLGARFGLERSTGAAGHSFSAGAFGEAGYGWFGSSDFRPGGAGIRSAQAPYGELGASVGYRTPLFSGTSHRLDFRVEAAVGSTLGAPGIVGPVTSEIRSDPIRSQWFRFGVSAVAHF